MQTVAGHLGNVHANGSPYISTQHGCDGVCSTIHHDSRSHTTYWPRRSRGQCSQLLGYWVVRPEVHATWLHPER